MRVLDGAESPRVILRWRADVSKICRGLNVTAYENKAALVTPMMRTGPLALFHSSLQADAMAAMDQAIADAPERDPANPVPTDKHGIAEAGAAAHTDDAHVIWLNTVQNDFYDASQVRVLWYGLLHEPTKHISIFTI